MSQARLYIKFDEEKNILIVEVTQDVAFKMMRLLRIYLWPEIERMTLQMIEYVNEEGHKYKDVRRYTIPAYKDKVEILFDAFKHMMANGIKSSIVNSDN